jgi:TonB family protein
MPVTWGVFAPRVLLPDAARGWSDEQLDAVLVHELSHVERGDMVSHLATRTAMAVWWWHPLMWGAARRARFERERACDDLVLAMGTRASDYAENLVAFVSSLRSPVAPPATLAMARRSQLEGRVMAILQSGVNRRGVSQSGILTAMLVMVLVWPLAAARPAESPAGPAPGLQEPLRVGGSVRAPRKFKNVAPVFPASAQADGRQGVVIIEAFIGSDGLVTRSKVIRSIGEDLDQAATDAVSQWEFEPTLLNGVAVPVIMTVTVNFSLADASAPPPPPPAPTYWPGVADAPPPPPAAPPATWSEGDDPLRVGGAIKTPKKITNVNPVYPPDAQDQRIQGVVIIEVRIDKDGRISDAKIIRGVPLLDDAAMDAVMQWEFEPTLLNGQPIPILMTVTVSFTLRTGH